MTPAGHKTSMAGYTLVELLVVLAIIGLLAGAAVPMLSAARPGLQAKAAARAVAQDLATVRQQAIDRGITARVVLSGTSGHYTLFPGGVRHGVAKGVVLAFRGPMHDEIDFFPDGSSTGGVILVSAADMRHRVLVRWPTGQIAVDD